MTEKKIKKEESVTKFYYIEVKFDKKWQLIHTTKRHVDALNYVRTHVGENDHYPMRIVKVTRTVVFGGEQHYIE